MRIVLASRNPGKLKELNELLAEYDLQEGTQQDGASTGLQLESQAQHNVPSPIEDGLTFVENALIKARAVASATGLPAIADDSGLVVPALDGAPGIHSARYAGTHGDDQANNNKLLVALDGQEDRHCFFYCAMVFLLSTADPTPIIATAAWHGTVLNAPRGTSGFGYDPLFLVAGREQTSAELAAAEKNRISHRGQAVAKLLAQMRVRLQSSR